jgi:hypothetical protein
LKLRKRNKKMILKELIMIEYIQNFKHRRETIKWRSKARLLKIGIKGNLDRRKDSDLRELEKTMLDSLLTILR